MNLKNNPDLTAWLTNPEQPLPESLKMAFVDRALEELKSQYPKSVFNGTEFENIAESNSLLSLSNAEAIYYIQTLLSQINKKAVMPFLDVYQKTTKENQFIWERNYDGKEIGFSSDELPNKFLGEFEVLKRDFLDSYSEEFIGFNIADKKVYKIIGQEVSGFYNRGKGGIEYSITQIEFPTLQEKMSLAFWRALSMEGKNVNEALEVVTKIYLIHAYV